MRVAVLSGKGGAGKTFVAVNLAATAERALYIDCDVEEPNGRLFLQPEQLEQQTVGVPLPSFDPERCNGCRKCVEFCHFNALFFAKNRPLILPEICHACGGCPLICPQKAVTETSRQVGMLERGRRGPLEVITGVLNPGEASPVPVIRSALKEGLGKNIFTVIDCPPGSSCSVMECVTRADRCILVTEPTVFGFHNFRMVYELVTLLGKPCQVVLNKGEGAYPPLEDFCQQKGLEICAVIPYRREIAAACAAGKIAVRESPEMKCLFETLLQKTGGAAE